jgi:transcriptional regulator with XRE-family HTH domain
LEPKEIGERIRRAREAQGMSQEKLAELISRNQYSVSEYESGKRRIYAHDLPTIARALNVPLVYFYEEVFSDDDLDRALLADFHRLDMKGRQKLLSVMQALVDMLSEDR